jgi:hypothetical protein
MRSHGSGNSPTIRGAMHPLAWTLIRFRLCLPPQGSWRGDRSHTVTPLNLPLDLGRGGADWIMTQGEGWGAGYLMGSLPQGGFSTPHAAGHGTCARTQSPIPTLAIPTQATLNSPRRPGGSRARDAVCWSWCHPLSLVSGQQTGRTRVGTAGKLDVDQGSVQVNCPIWTDE